MKTKLLHFFRGSILLLVTVALVGTGLLATPRQALAAPASVTSFSPLALQAAMLPDATCTLAGSTRTCELWAMAGTLTLPDATSVDIWGYADSAIGPAQLPGPVLIVNEAETVNIILHNSLAFTTSLSVPGQDFALDLIGVAPGAVLTYSFTASNVGTYAYEAGLITPGAGPDGNRQVMMGLFGALIVRPSGHPTWAYADPTTAFNVEAMLTFSEIDPSFNADPLGFSLTDFSPKYWLINGKAYSQTDAIVVAPGDPVLLRYLNAGVQERSIGLLGVDQTVLGSDSSQLPVTNQYTVVAETLGAGESLDTLTQIPISVTVGTRYPVYNTGLQQLQNNGVLASPGGPLAFGGILTFLEVSGGIPVPDVGPLVTSVSVSPETVSGVMDVTLSAVLDETTTGGSNVVAAEYFTDTLGTDGAGVSIPVSVPASVISVSTIISGADVASWLPGDVTIYVHGQDASGNWGPVSSAILDVVKFGPAIRGMVLTPDSTNGSVDVGIQATADDTDGGNVNIVAAEYFIDTPGTDGSGTPMSLNIVAPISSLTASISAASVNGLSEGEHAIYIHAQDEASNWGGFGVIVLRVDRTGPLATGEALGPNPNNGTLSVNPSTYAVRLLASFSDMGIVSSFVQQAEGFIDTVGVDGAGFPLMAKDALFNGVTELGFVDIPLPTIQLLDEGPHAVYFHGKDSAGNWGAYGVLSLVIDKTGPTASNVVITPPNPRPNVTFVLLTATLNDLPNGIATASTIVGGEWFRGVDPGVGNGTPLLAVDGAFNSSNEAVRALINIRSWRNGTYVISVRGKDIAGNWGPVTTQTLVISGHVNGFLLVDGFEMGNLAAWSSTSGAVSVTSSADMEGGLYGMEAAMNGSTPAYVVDTTPFDSASYEVNFLFNPNGFDTGGTEVDILTGWSSDNTALFGIQYERTAGGTEVRGWVLQAGTQIFTNWVHIADGPQTIGVSWESKDAAAFSLLLGGTPQETLTELSTSAYLLAKVWLGPSAGLTADMAGTLYFDGFVSKQLNVMQLIYLPLVVK